MKGQQVVSPDGTEVIVLGDIGQAVIFEDEHVRVWELTLEPGGVHPWHLHHNPYVALCLDDSAGRMDWLDGAEPRFPPEYIGGAVLRPVSPIHRFTNIGDHRYSNRLIELKGLGEDQPGGGEPDDVDGGVRSLPDDEITVHPGLQLLIDTPYVAVWRTDSTDAALPPGTGVPRVHVSLASEGPAGVAVDHDVTAPEWIVELRYLDRSDA